jgi:hypothetical protein
MLKGFDKVSGYVWRGSSYCGTCLRRQLEIYGLIKEQKGSTEQVLDLCAWNKNIDRSNEWTYDSWKFPKVIFKSDAEFWMDKCSVCGKTV